MDSKITEIFYLVDEFYKEFEKDKEGHILTEKTSVKRRKCKFTMSDSEVITIVILFHLKKYRCLKHFYIMHVQEHMQADFPKTVAYNRFVELQQKALMPMAVFLQLCCLGKCTGVSFIDSTPIRVCHIRREFQHKTGYTNDQLNDLSKLIHGEDCDLFDVLSYVAYHKTLVPRLKRAERARIHMNGYNKNQQEFLDFVLSQYVQSGISELDDSKLPDILELKYKALADAKAKLGTTKNIRETFIGFQEYLYG